MVINAIEKNEITIENIVNRWDISEELKQKKIKILELWREKINDNEKFMLLLRICNEFQYYSKKLTADTYKSLFEETREKHEDFTGFLKETLFTPLRSRERMESSIDMFSEFRLVNNIDATSTFVEGPIIFIKKFREATESLRIYIIGVKEEQKELNEKISTLDADLQKIEEVKVKGKIMKKMKLARTRLNKLDKKLEEAINNFKNKYYYVKNIVIIDDFVGSGSSGEKLVKGLARELEGTNIDISFYLWILETSTDGLEIIETLAKSLEIKLAIKFGEISKNVLEENEVFTSDELQPAESKINTILRDYRIPKSRYSKNHALASFVNAPNNNLALLSNESAQWKALFLRKKRFEEERKTEDIKELKDIMKFIIGG